MSADRPTPTCSWKWLPRHFRSNVTGQGSNEVNAGSPNESIWSAKADESLLIESILQADGEGKSTLEIEQLLKAQFDVQITSLEVEAKLKTWKTSQTAWEKYWTIVFRAVDELTESGAQCRLSSEGRVLSDEEVKDLRECFFNPSLADGENVHESGADVDSGWDVVNFEESDETRLPRIDIEVLETTGPWTSIKTFSDGVPSSVKQQSPTPPTFTNVKKSDLPLQSFEKAILRMRATDQLLETKNEGILQVYNDMQRLVANIQRATNSTRPMDPAALFLYLRSFMPRQHQHTPHNPIGVQIPAHGQPSSVSPKPRFSPKPPLQTASSFDWSHHILIDKNDMSATTVLRTLLFSVANNFAGLDYIPTSTILTHLRQTPSALSLLRNILRLPGHTPRALADNLLKTAVQAQDVEAARLLLSLRDKDTATDVNKIRAKTGDGRGSSTHYSPPSGGKPAMPKTLLEQAAEARHVDMVELLLQHGADPNYIAPGEWSSYSKQNRNPLAAVVGRDPRMMAGWMLKLEQKGEERKEAGMRCAKMLLDAGAQFEPTIVDKAVANGEIGLAVLLGMSVPAKHHRPMMSHAMIVKLVRYCEKEEEAVALVKRWDWMCREVKCGECAERYGEGGLTWVLIEACRRGFLELLELFTKNESIGGGGGGKAGPENGNSFRDVYGQHIKWELVLCSSMRTRDPAFIDRVLSMSPNIKTCKPDTIDQHSDDFERGPKTDRLSTPLSEAIENDLPDYIAICETHGALEVLKTDMKHRKYAFEAAAAVGNVEYINKILSVAPIAGGKPGALEVYYGDYGELGSTNPSDVTTAMSIAILNGHDDAFYALFNAGGDIDDHKSGSPRTPDPVFAAVLKRKLPVLRTLLAAGGGTSESTHSFYHSFSQPLKAPAHQKLDGGRTGYVGCEFSAHHAHLERETSDLLEQAVLWGRRDVMLGLKTLRPAQSLRWMKDDAMSYLADNHDMLDFLVEERMVDGSTLERIMVYAFEKQDEALLNKMFELRACHGDGFAKALTAGLKCPQLLRKALDEHASLIPTHYCNFRGRGTGNAGTHQEGNEQDLEKPALFLGCESLIEALELEDSEELKAEGKAFGRMRGAIPDGRRVGRQAAWVLLESGLVDVRGAKYSRTPMTVALGAHKKIMKKMFGEGGNMEVDVEGYHQKADMLRADENAYNLEDEVAESRAIISALLARGCHPDDTFSDTSSYTKTTFLEAIATKDVHLVRDMIRHGATINYPATLDVLAIHTHYRPVPPRYSAAILESVEMRRNFLWGLTRTPLQQAVEVNSAAIVDLLLNNQTPGVPKADPTAPAAHRMGATALQLAAWQGNCGIAATLLAHGADINAPPGKLYGRSALEAAAEGGRLEMIDFLKANGYQFTRADYERTLKKAEEACEAACAGRIRELLNEIVVVAK